MFKETNQHVEGTNDLRPRRSTRRAKYFHSLQYRMRTHVTKHRSSEARNNATATVVPQYVDGLFCKAFSSTSFTQPGSTTVRDSMPVAKRDTKHTHKKHTGAPLKPLRTSRFFFSLLSFGSASGQPADDSHQLEQLRCSFHLLQANFRVCLLLDLRRIIGVDHQPLVQCRHRLLESPLSNQKNKTHIAVQCQRSRNGRVGRCHQSRPPH